MKQKFNPPLHLRNAHLQTIYSTLFRRKEIHDFYIEKFVFSDGDFTECYWYNKPFDDNKPVVILFHGLAGSYKSPYIQGIMQRLDKEGFNNVLMHFRGCSGTMNNLPKSYHSGKTDDALEFITSVKNRFKNNKLFAVGYSLGANMLLKLLGEQKEQSLLDAAVSVSSPFELEMCTYRMKKGFSRFYQYVLLKDLKRDLLKKYDKHDMESLLKLKKEDIKKLSDFLEFDDAYTAPVHGFKNAKEYYSKCSSKQFLKDIKTPTLMISAFDDPFMVPEVLPYKKELSEYIEFEVTRYGGHVGFIHGSLFKPKYYLEDRISEYFLNLL